MLLLCGFLLAEVGLVGLLDAKASHGIGQVGFQALSLRAAGVDKVAALVAEARGDGRQVVPEFAASVEVAQDLLVTHVSVFEVLESTFSLFRRCVATLGGLERVVGFLHA